MKVALFGMTVAAFILFCAAIYYGLGWTREVLGPGASWAAGLGALAIYVGSVAIRARYPDLEIDDPADPEIKLPDTSKVAPTGIHYLMPVFILVWCLMVEELSPGLSAFYGTCALLFLVLTQRPLIALFRGEANWIGPFRAGFDDAFQGAWSRERAT